MTAALKLNKSFYRLDGLDWCYPIVNSCAARHANYGFTLLFLATTYD